MNITPSNQTLILASENRFSNAAVAASGASPRRPANAAAQHNDASVIEVSVSGVDLGNPPDAEQAANAEQTAYQPGALVAQPPKLPVTYKSARTAADHYALTQRLSIDSRRPRYIDVHA